MRSDAREAAFKTVYARLMGGDIPKAARNVLYDRAELSGEEKVFAEKLLETVGEHSEELTEKLDGAVIRFADYRIYAADKAALLLALAEIFYFDDIPPVVSVSEAVAIARKYSTEKSAEFVNGVLGGIINV